jgi:predicted lysophospholipase L1 biosynthesis ABC-type transport system permease subunit
MTPEQRRLLLDWLAAEEREGRRLSELLAELEQKHAELAPLARFLAIKETEETARRTVLQREQWFRSFSWRLVGALFTFGVLGLLLFLAWGGEEAFLASILFFAGGASFYLVVQAMASWSSYKDRKALAQVRERYRQELEELRRQLGASPRD